MLGLYRYITNRAEPLLASLLEKRLQKGKEDQLRLKERKGIPSISRPQGKLFWVHGASVGEAQSALILIQKLLDLNPEINVLVTTGTTTSSRYLQTRLPERTIHQFYPLDHPTWVEYFVQHWKPDAVFWMESELWPNMLLEIQKAKIPAALINARLSDKSFRFWKSFSKSMRKLLTTFQIIIAQTSRDQIRFQFFGANTHQADNIKFSAKPLTCDETELQSLMIALNNRPCWVYASTHAGEEELACRVHQIIKNTLPDLLTIIIPRHPQRGADIQIMCQQTGLKTRRRTEAKIPPGESDDIYIADTLGELGLFYRLAPIACIGRSFSNDGGGGHNPIEAAQLHAAVLYGPNVQYQQDIYDEMQNAGAATQVTTETELTEALLRLLSQPDQRKIAQESGYRFARQKENTIDRIMDILTPITEKILKS